MKFLPPSRDRLRSVATAVAVTLTLALAAGAGCKHHPKPLPSVQEKLKETRIYGAPELEIGVSTVEPRKGVGGAENVYDRFELEIAYYIAQSLGYRPDRVKLVPLATEEREEFLVKGQVDLVVSSFSMTGGRAENVLFAGPYLVTSQEVMVPIRLRDSIRSIEDLKDPKLRVCASGGSTSEAELKRRGIASREMGSVAECVEGIRKGDYDAVSSDKAILVGFDSQYPGEFAIVNMRFGVIEQIGVGVNKNDHALREVVAYSLHRSYLAGERDKNSPWLAAYNNTLGKHLGPGKQPPPREVPELGDVGDKVAPS